MIQRLLNILTTAVLTVTVLSLTFGTYHFYKWLNPTSSLNSYVDYLTDEAASRGHIVNFRTVGMSIVTSIPVAPEDAIGVCLIHPLTMQRTILLLEKFWVRATDSARKSLLLHELGHCYYSLDHDDTKNNVMYSSMHASTLLSKELLDEFFIKAYPHHILPAE